MSYHLTLKFASKVLRWPLASAGYLLSLKGAVSLLVLLVLPVLGAAATQRRAVPAVVVDTWVARCSLGFLAAGSLCVGGASVFQGGGREMGVLLVVVGMVLGAAGNGITQTMRGLVAHFAVGVPGASSGGGGDDGEEGEREGTGTRMGQLYAGIALLELVAVLTGEVAFAALFGMGMRLSRSGFGGGWLGLPFYAAGVSTFEIFTLSFGAYMLWRGGGVVNVQIDERAVERKITTSAIGHFLPRISLRSQTTCCAIW